MKRFLRFFLYLAGGIALIGGLSGCVTTPTPSIPPTTPEAPPTQPTPAPPPLRYQPVAWSALPGWSQDTLADAWPAWQMSCRALLKRESERVVWTAPCQAAETVDPNRPDAIRAFFETHFQAWQILADNVDGTTTDRGLITGYYEPLLAGSHTQDTRYRYPLYPRPDDLLTVELASLYPELEGKRVRGRLVGNKVLPYFSRAEIDRGNPALKATPLFYVDDAMDAFFLHIQGSGRLQLPDGRVVRLGYADQNGHPYRAIGGVLMQRGDIARENLSMQTIKAWGRANPNALPALLDENPSYVFFREVPPPEPGTLDARIDGPIGALGVPLLAQRTIAIDRTLLPLGAPFFLDAIDPDSRAPIQRLTMAQDTGGAIRGAIRADFFCGTGKDAGERAGKMRETGRLWLLWPKGQEPEGRT
ncbi:MAG: MltA domain-containing protein [Burkholderiales bacterium]|nr:MltA domain-containing protein [Burkholderiales bacterium]